MTNLEKLIADNKWQDIKDAPRDKTILLTGDNKYWSGDWDAKDDYWRGTPSTVLGATHFRPLPDDRLAKITKWYHQILQAIIDEDECNVHDMQQMARNALKQAEKIAGEI